MVVDVPVVSAVDGERFAVLIEGCRPTGMVTTEPREPGPLTTR